MLYKWRKSSEPRVLCNPVSLSPNDFNGNNANVWNVNEDGKLGNDNVNNDNGVRPAISFK